MEERLQKTLASAGIGSRRTCEEWIAQGRVRVNGQVVTKLGTKVDLDKDKVQFDGQIIRQPARRYYLALNKPKGVVSSRSDPHAGRLVTDLVDIGGNPMLRPVGRLDADSDGLIFLTDDGDFLFKMTHPRYHVPKTYRVEVQGVPNADALQRLRKGIMLEDGMSKPAENVRLLRGKENADGTGRAALELTIYEGRNRQVRRMMQALGHSVTRLTRVRIGAVQLSGLPPGAWRHLTAGEIEALTAEIPAAKKVFCVPAAVPAPTIDEAKSTITASKETDSWPKPPLLTPPRAPSSRSSLRTTRLSPSPISLNSPEAASTMD